MKKEIYLAGGCFWGTEHFMKQIRGVSFTETGFANGSTANPTYKEVYTDATGYAETVRVEYDPAVITLRQLLRFYFMAIDPLSVNRQAHDIGTRYRTGIYYTDPTDLPVIREVYEAIAEELNSPLAVELEPLRCFFPAEDYHQDYLENHPEGYCHLSPALMALARRESMGSHLLVVGIGEALWDVFPDGAKLGGATANFAYHVSRFGIRSVAVSALGKDELGDRTERELGKKVEICMERVPYPTGTVQVTLDGEGIPRYEIREGVAWDHIPSTDRLIALASRCSAVCFGSLAQRCPESRETILAFLDAMPSDAIKIFDINLRQHFYSKAIIETSLEKCNILKINDDELKVIGKMFDIDYLPDEEKCRRIRSYFHLSTLILTCGTEGSYVFGDGVESFLPTPRVDVVDTVGAGDAFTGAFCAGILLGLPLVNAHELAVKVAAHVCTQAGAMPFIPADIGIGIL